MPFFAEGQSSFMNQVKILHCGYIRRKRRSRRSTKERGRDTINTIDLMFFIDKAQSHFP